MFFQKRVPARGAPEWLHSTRIQFPSGRSADELCPLDLAHVAWAAQMGTIVFHPWPVRATDVDRPDELRIDLDPQPGTDFTDAVAAAAEVRALLDELGATGWPKTSGGRGVHIYLRIAPRWTFTEVRRATIALAREVERRRPDLVTTAWWKEERGKHVFIDYNQMARDRTIACAYSCAPTPAPPSPPRSPGTSCRRSTRRLRPAYGAGAARRAGRPARRYRRLAVGHQSAAGVGRPGRRRRLGDLPYPPDHPKMPGEPKRVQPSKDRDRKQSPR